MAIATIVDSTDGTLARKVRIKEVVPGFDGRRLDDIVDFLNYTFLPLLLIWRAGILPPGQEAWLVPAAFGQRLWLLPGPGQDRRRLFPGVPVALELGRALPLCAAAGRVGCRWRS